MKYKVGDRVRVNSIDWYNKNKNSVDNYDVVFANGWVFSKPMSNFCGKELIIEKISHATNPPYYKMKDTMFAWTDEMIEGLVEEEDLIPKFGEYSDNEPLDIPTMTTDFVKEHGLPCPEGYQFVDENGNVINATKIVLEKKHNDKLKLESTKTVREYWSEYARIYIEIYEDEPNECVLTHLYTLEGYRQKGYGRQALIEAESIAKELGCHTTYLKVETDSWMHQWYLRMGYKWYKTADKEYTWLIKNLTSIEEKKMLMHSIGRGSYNEVLNEGIKEAVKILKEE